MLITNRPESEKEFGCRECWSNTADTAQDAHSSRLSPKAFVTLHTRIVDESHFRITIAQCPSCQQLFISVFTETMDRLDGEDPQYRTIMPIQDSELDLLLSFKETTNELSLIRAIESLDPKRCSLRHDFPKLARRPMVYWGYGIHVGPHD